MNDDDDHPPLWQEIVVFMGLCSAFFVALHITVWGYEWLMR